MHKICLQWDSNNKQRVHNSQLHQLLLLIHRVGNVPVDIGATRADSVRNVENRRREIVAGRVPVVE